MELLWQYLQARSLPYCCCVSRYSRTELANIRKANHEASSVFVLNHRSQCLIKNVPRKID